MSVFYFMSYFDFCNALDRVQDYSPTVVIPVRWVPQLDIIEDEDAAPEDYELEEGEIYESVERRNLLAAMNFLNSLTLN